MALISRIWLHLFVALASAVAVWLYALGNNGVGVPMPSIVDLLVYASLIVFPSGLLQLWIANRYGRTVADPLSDIATQTRTMAQGATSGRVTVGESSTDEVKAVATAINELANKATKDIQDSKRLEQVRSEFIANVSHELRTPIFSVQGYLETLLDGAIEDPEVSVSFLEKAYANALRLNVLLNDLIDISRIESGELKFSFRFVNIMQVLSEIIPVIAMRAAQRNVTVEVQPDLSENISVYADRDRITQVLTNLIDNAIKYNQPNGKVLISVSKVPDGVEVQIADTGIGIAKENQTRIFERFYRVDKDRSREVGGTGLGLAIVKHIVEAHLSKLTVQSELGKGTTISFLLKGA